MHYTAKQPNMFPHPAVCPTFQELLKETTKQDKTKTQQLSSPHPLILVHPPTPDPPGAILAPSCPYIYCVYDTCPLFSE